MTMAGPAPPARGCRVHPQCTVRRHVTASLARRSLRRRRGRIALPTAPVNLAMRSLVGNAAGPRFCSSLPSLRCGSLCRSMRGFRGIRAARARRRAMPAAPDVCHAPLRLRGQGMIHWRARAMLRDQSQETVPLAERSIFGQTRRRLHAIRSSGPGALIGATRGRLTDASRGPEHSVPEARQPTGRLSLSGACSTSPG